MKNEDVIKLVDGLCLSWENGTQDLESANKIIGSIYRAVHSHRLDASCYSVHENWRIEAEKTFKELTKQGMC